LHDPSNFGRSDVEILALVLLHDERMGGVFEPLADDLFRSGH